MAKMFPAYRPSSFLLISFQILLLSVHWHWASADEDDSDYRGVYVLPPEEEPNTPPSEPSRKPWSWARNCTQANCSLDLGQPSNGSSSACTECALPYGQAEQLAWLLSVPFSRGVDPRQSSNSSNGTIAGLPLEFDFCFREGLYPAPIKDCREDGYVICYESHLDPARARLNPSLEVPNIDNFVARVCNEQTQEGNFGKGSADQLRRWERQARVPPRHGFMISQYEMTLGVWTSFDWNRMSFQSATATGEGECLRVRLFDEQSPFAFFYLVDKDGRAAVGDALGKYRERMENVARRLTNGETLVDDGVRGPWLLGLDMFAGFRAPFSLKIVKRGGKCVPKAKLRSTMIDVKRKGAAVGEGEEEQQQWEVATADTIRSQFGDKLKLEEDGSILLNYGLAEDWLNLTFAVPSADSLSLALSMSTRDAASTCWGASQCERNSFFLDYNRVRPDCRVMMCHSQEISQVQIPSLQIVSKITRYDLSAFGTLNIVGNQLEHSGTSEYSEPNKYVLSADCAVQNAPIEEELGRVANAIQPFLLRLFFWPGSLTSVPVCDNSLKIRFDPSYELLVPSKKRARKG